MSLELPPNATVPVSPACPDDTFGPWAGETCRGGFDFTLFFEEAILGIPVQILLLLFVLPRMMQLAVRNARVKPGLLRLSKAIGSLALIAFNAALLSLWLKDPDEKLPRSHTSATLPLILFTLIASIFAAVLSWFEHDRSTRPSLLVTGWLFFSTFLDLPRIRTLWLINESRPIASLFTTSFALRIVLLILESGSKRGLLYPEYQNIPENETRTVFRAVGFWWLNPLFGAAYNKNIGVKDLPPLEHKMRSEHWHKIFLHAWDNNPNQMKPGALFTTAFKCLLWPMLACVPPRLLQIAFTYSQPYLIRKAVELAVTKQINPFNNWAYGLIGAFALVYTGLALTISHYNWYIARASGMMRGGIMALVMRESLQLDCTMDDSSSSAAITLINTDTSNVIRSASTLHDMWANCAEIAVAIYILQSEMGVASVMPIALALTLMIGASWLAVPSGRAQAAWIKASEERVSVTSKTLGSVKWLRISGLNDIAFGALQKLRIHELQVSRKYRLFLGASLILLISSTVWSPVLTFSLYAGLAEEDGKRIDAATVFTAYSALSVLSGPLNSILLALPTLAGSLQSAQRIQNHLNMKKRKDTRVETGGTLAEGHADDGPSAAASSYHLEEEEKTPSEAGFPLIERGFRGGYASSRFSQEHPLDSSRFIAHMHGRFPGGPDTLPIIDIDELLIPREQITMILGPVGCGKSLLLKALLGELDSFDGTVWINNAAGIAYCDQAPWIPNDTVRNIVVGACNWEEAWYRRVIKACALEQDIATWPEGENTMAGSQGISMSGGQRQRLAIARAVYSRKSFLVMDDVLSALDATTEDIIFNSLWGEYGLLKGSQITTIMASSDDRRVSFVDQLVFLNHKGRIEKKGSPTELDLALVHELLPPSRHANPPPPEAKKPGAAQGATGPAGPSLALVKQSGLDPDDPARRKGSWGMYALYAGAAGRVSVSIFVFTMAVYAFSSSFPTIWLGWWAEDSFKTNYKGNGYWLGIYVLLAVGSTAGAAIGIWQLAIVIIQKCGLFFHQKLLDSVSHASLSFHSSVDSGTTVNRFSEDLRLIDMELPTSAFGMVTTMAFLFAQIIIVAVMSKYLAAAFPVLLGMLYVVQHFYLRTSRQLRLIDIEAMAPVNSLLIESLSGRLSIRAFQWDEVYMQRAFDLIDKSQQAKYMLSCVQCWLSFHVDMIVTLLAISFIVITTTLREQIGPANMGVGLTSVLGLGSATKTVLSFWVMLEVCLGGIMRVHEFTKKVQKEEGPDEVFHDREFPDWPAQGSVELNGVTASYESSGKCLDNVTLSIQPGEKVAICGRTGSGKSSLTLALLRLINLDSGSIVVDGVDVTDLSHEYVRSRLVALPQQAFIMDGSVRLNIDPLGSAMEQDIIQALRIVQLWNKIEKKGGLDIIVDDSLFSAGEGQLLVFARAILKAYVSQSKVLILDEFTSSLDAATGEIIEGLLMTHFVGWTIIAVAHKLESILNFDKVAVLERGRLLEYGQPWELLQSDTVFKTLYEASRER